MTFANHFLTGSLIAVSVKEPALVAPLAFASHYALDALPHYGYYKGGYDVLLQHKATYVLEVLGVLGVIALLLTGEYGWNIVLLGGLMAVLPDVEWPYRYFRYEKPGKTPRDFWFTRFHYNIQWCERPWGVFIEVAFYVVGYLAFINLTN